MRSRSFTAAPMLVLPTLGLYKSRGDRNRLSDYEGQLRRFSPDVIVDLILSSGGQARQLVETAHEIARRVIAISSMDVYRAWGVVHEVEAGPWIRCRSRRTPHSAPLESSI